MNWYFVCASMLTVIIGIVHSALGEIRIFRHLRVSGVDSGSARGNLGTRQIGILWATWHLASVLALYPAAVLVWLAKPAPDQGFQDGLYLHTTGIAVTMLAGAILVLSAPGLAILAGSAYWLLPH